MLETKSTPVNMDRLGDLLTIAMDGIKAKTRENSRAII
jgi:hypothetical protein